MITNIKHFYIFVLVLLTLLGGIPLLLFWIFIGRAPSISAEEAYRLLLQNDQKAILIDVRGRNDYSSEHIAGSINMPHAQILGYEHKADLPEEWDQKTILLICNSGLSSATAALHLKNISELDVYNVRGGIQAWVAENGEAPTSQSGNFQLASGETEPLYFIESSLFQQWAAVIAGFVIKPVYMILSLLLIVSLRRQKSFDLVLLRWGLISFLLGEAACTVNYLFFNEQSLFYEYLHSVGMVFSFSFVGLALFEGADQRIIKFSDSTSNCALINLCHGCIKYKDTPCSLKRLFEMVILFLMVLAMIPLSTQTVPVSYNTIILNTFYNYTHAGINQLYEIRNCPLTALILFILSWFALKALWKGNFFLAKLLFWLGIGHLGFSFFRLMLLSIYINDMVWFIFWEELTELMLMVSVGWVLWIFKDRLFKETINFNPLLLDGNAQLNP